MISCIAGLQSQKQTAKGKSAEEDASAVHLLGSHPNRGETVALFGAECCVVCVHISIIILHELPVYKPVFFYISLTGKYFYQGANL